MRYLVFYIENGEKKSFLTNWFDYENNFNDQLQMVVFDLKQKLFLSGPEGWKDIETDHL